MLRKWLGAGAALTVLLAGCREPKGACDTDSDCGQGQTCDAQAKLCFLTVTQFSGFEFVYPQGLEGAVKSGPVKLRARLVPPAGDATPNFPETVGFKVSQSGTVLAEGVLTHTGQGNYEGDWTAPGGDATYELTLSYDEASVSETKSFRTDNTGPKFAVSVPAADAGVAPPDAGVTYADPVLPNAWRRDQVVAVTVTADEAVAASSVKLVVHALDAGTAFEEFPVTQSSSCDSKFCGVANVDLAKPAMNAFRGNFSLEVRGADTAGNDGIAADAGAVPVTRWKWRYRATTVGLVRAAPAVGNTGVVYLGSTAGNDGQIAAIRPDGTPAWPAIEGAVASSPTVGMVSNGVERVYFARKVGVKSAAGYLTNTNPAFNVICEYTDVTGDDPVAIDSGLAFTQVTAASAGTETVYGNFAGRNGGTLFAMRPDASTKCPTKGLVGSVKYPGNMVVVGNSVAFAESTGVVKAYSLDNAGDWGGVDWNKLAQPSPTSLALANGRLVGGSDDGSASQIFTLPADGSAAAAGTTVGSPAWSPSVGPGDTVAVGLESKNLTLFPIAAGPGAPVSVAPHLFKGAPVWGANGLVYLASSASSLIQARSGSAVAWSFTPGNGDVFEASMNLDCSRNDDGGIRKAAPSVLYAASSSGNLYAVVVDSRGLDSSAPWPRYQHDARNTGNPATPITDCR